MEKQLISDVVTVDSVTSRRGRISVSIVELRVAAADGSLRGRNRDAITLHRGCAAAWITEASRQIARWCTTVEEARAYVSTWCDTRSQRLALARV